MTVNFFSFTPEIRLKIYSELLVLSEPIIFVADYGPPSPPLIRSSRVGLYPALLRINKQAHGEASPLLYSNNCFQFPNVYNRALSATDSAHIAPFLRQIGSYASLVRHICIPFPTFGDYRHERARLHEAHIENLALIRNTCTHIATLELLLQLDRMSYAFSDSLFATKALDLLGTQFETILSLKKIIVNLQIYGSEDLSDLTKMMHDRTWTVEITILPPKVWISNNERVEFDNEEDCEAYNNEQLVLDMRRERNQEDERWKEEYDRRRNDPYWKNDSDYD
ncbi:hypothetical protein VC83_03531 [Pseudogymnoascus destructans]|uniref:Uncharacterized protein n=2 Tax=Pseudogymnoascus destructans TaxID=655981 RepID=L8G6T6_PSED2|nr:uncharacterized protein VC83_03531 [Pseudogymnoascus destructans]ELR08388.1 hypothetical protein GMDG_03177 [Pseudogymnoascus destructans 20631-21]OAF60533.1 hypothetical protein VC83_03531 [Pseudogymnoascus destructans]